MSLAARAVWFGRDRPEYFGMFHRVEGRPPAERGVVICASLGAEGLVAYRSFGHLAERLREAGIPTLRFDYAGTGDSDGDFRQPQMLRRWLDSLSDAVAFLRQEAGVSHVSLVGLRFGATLATLHAAERGGIVSLALWAPVAKGRPFIRELQARASIARTWRPPQPPEDDAVGHLQAVGFEFTPETQEDIKGIDLMQLGSRPAERALVIPHDDLGATDPLAARLVALGTMVDCVPIHGSSHFLLEQDVLKVMPSAEAIDRIATWLEADTSWPSVPTESLRVAVSDHLAVQHASRWSREEVDAHPLTERAVRMGIDERLFGILSEPVAERGGHDGYAVLLLNSGGIPRVGPGRLYTDLARLWASLGIRVLRLDLGGIGDSGVAPGFREHSPYSSGVVAEVATAAEWLTVEQGSRGAVAMGMCSGAYQAFQAALAGVPLAGCVLINPIVFHWDEYARGDGGTASTARLLRFSLSRIDRWAMVFRGKVPLRAHLRHVGRLLWASGRARLKGALRGRGRGISGEPDLARELRSINDRGVDCFIVFAAQEAGMRYLRTHAGAALRSLGATAGLRVLELPGGDHIFSPPAARARLVEAVTRYLLGRFADAEPRVAGADPRSG